MYMPIGIFGVSVATAAIPDLARHAADAAFSDMRDTLSWGVRLMLMLSVPATVGLMVLARPIVELIFQRGAFGAVATREVATRAPLLRAGDRRLLHRQDRSPSFYSLQDARTPVIVSLITIASISSSILAEFDSSGFLGLALGTAIAANINAGLLLILLGRPSAEWTARGSPRSLAKISSPLTLMGVAGYFSAQWLRDVLPGDGVMSRLVRVGAAIGASLAMLALSAWVLRIHEFRAAMTRLVRRGSG